MIQLLNPAALWAALAVAAPILIHLWSRRVGRRLLLGTLRWLQPTLSAQARALRLHDIWLLLLRCSILLLLALWWATPIWQGNGTGGGSAPGRVLISPTLLQREQPRAFYHRIDSLLAAGHTLHALAPGYPAVTLETKWPAKESMPQNYWLLAAEADAQQPAGTLLALHTDDQAVHYTGQRPSLSARVQWQVWPQTQAADASPVLQLTEAWYSADSVWMLLTARQRDELIWQTVAASTTQLRAGIALALSYTVQGTPTAGGWQLRLLQAGKPVGATLQAHVQTPLQIAIYTPAIRLAEVAYLQAAYQAIAAQRRQTLQVQRATQPNDTLLAQVYVWAFDSAPPIHRWPAGSTCIWMHAAQGSQASASSALYSATLPIDVDTRVYVQPIALDSATALVHTDANQPVLAVQQVGSRQLVHVLLSLVPTATNWMLQPRFVYVWWQLLQPAANPMPGRLPPQQIIPARLADQPTQQQATPLGNWVLLCIMVLFTTERWLANRQGT